MSTLNFWDFQNDLRKPAEPPRPPGDRPLTVTQLTVIIDKALRAGVPSPLAVQGEVSNYKLHGGSGHAYFTLKDATACIDCVMFRDDARTLRFKPIDGMELIAAGRVGVYGQRGRYQLYVSTLSPIGQGALELARQQILAKLQAEGLFDPERKKPIPAYPQRIALVTSTQTAAIQDMYKVLRRFPHIRLLVCHVPVQGDGSAKKIAAALKTLNRDGARLRAEVIIVARGGGSLEDLWEFNEECVARAVAASRIPVITGIGHEIDVCIADLAADYHAHTPTEAAQVATQLWRTAPDLLDGAASRLRRELRALVQDCRQRLIGIERHECFRRPLDRVNQLRQLLDDRQRQLSDAVRGQLRTASDRLARMGSRLQERHPRNRLELSRTRLDAFSTRLARAAAADYARRTSRVQDIARRLESLHPHAVLGRGYSITTLTRGGAIVRSATQVNPGDALVTRLADGQIESTVQDTRQLRLFDA